MSGIFISYRRSDNPDATGRIYDRLVSEFGKSRVFKDVDSIPLGQDFRGHLNDVVGNCAAVLAIIGPRWTDARNAAGTRRLEDPDDFVRIELEAALARDIPVVPVLVGHAAMSSIADLPASLSSMVFRQSIEVRPDPDFHHDATRLVSALRAIVDPNAPQVDPQAPPAPNAMEVIHHKRVRRLAWMTGLAAVAALTSIALAVPALRYLRQVPLPETRSEINTPATDGLISWFALSPDGRQLVFIARTDGEARLWLRALATTTAHPLPGTEGASLPFWSPDGRSIGFFTGNALKRLDLDGGSPLTLVTGIDAGGGGAWHKDGYIIFGQGPGKPFARVSATGGAATNLPRTAPADLDLRIPEFLPDGRRFVYAALDGKEPGIYLGSLDGTKSVRLSADSGPIAYLPGWLFSWRSSESLLLAQRLDADKGALVGEAITITEGMGAVSASATGLVAYRSGLTQGANQLEWRTRSGGELGVVGNPDQSYLAPRVSPDGHRVVVSRGTGGTPDVWMLEGDRSTRVTFDAKTPGYPVWSPDGRQIVFASLKSGISDLYQMQANGGEEARLLLASDQTKYASSWSPDGRYLLYFSTGQSTSTDLWVLPMTGDRKPWVFLRTPFTEVWGQFSPDGKWVAYQSNESGQFEIYVRPFNAPGADGAPPAASSGKWQVSTAGGISPAWSLDGKELYYINREGDMTGVSIDVNGTTLVPGRPVRLFKSRVLGGGEDIQRGRQYDVTADGRFLINAVVGSDVTPPITLIQNWNPEAKK